MIAEAIRPKGLPARAGRITLRVAFTAVLLWLVVQRVDWARTLDVLRGADYRLFAPACLFLFLSLIAKALRWQVLLAPIQRLPLRRMLSLVLIAYFSNNVLPSNTGDLVRNYILGKRENLAQATVFATIVVEKLLDTATLALCLVVITRLYALPQWIGAVAIVAVAVVAGLGLGSWLLARRASVVASTLAPLVRAFPPARRLLGVGDSLAIGLRLAASPRTLLPAAALSAAVWGVLALSYLAIVRALAIDAPPASGVLLVALIGLGSAIPAMGNLGSLELVCLAAFAVYGAGSGPAIAFVVLLRAARLLPIGLGYVSFARQGLWGRARSTQMDVAVAAPDAEAPTSNGGRSNGWGARGLGSAIAAIGPDRGSAGRWPAIALLLIVAAGLAVRMWKLGDNSLWVDEIATAYYVQPGSSWWFTITNPLDAPIPAPPLLFMLTRVAAMVGQSEYFLRLPAVFAGVLGIVVTYRFARRLAGPVTAVIAALLLAVSRFHIHYSQDARYYPPLLLFCMVSLYCFWRALDLDAAEPPWRAAVAAPRRRWWIGFFLGTLAAIYVHLFGLFVPVVQALFVGWLALQEIVWARQNRASIWPFVRRVIAPFALVGATILLTYAPMFSYVVAGLGGPRGVGTDQRQPLTWQVVSQYFLIQFNGFTAGNNAASYVFFMLFLLGVAGLASRRHRGLLLLLLYLFVPITVVALIRPQHFFSAKYVIFTLPVYLSIIGYGVANVVFTVRSIPARFAVGTALAAFLSLFSIATYGSYFQTEKQDWRTAVHFLNQVAQPGDVVIVAGSKVAFGAAEPLQYAFKYYGLETPGIQLGAESPFQDAFVVAKKYQQSPRVWVFLTPSKTNHQLRMKWLNKGEYQAFHYTKIAIFFKDSSKNEAARKQEIDQYFHVALDVKANWRTTSNLAMTYVRAGDQQKAQQEYQRALKENPDKVSFYLGLAKLYMKQQRYEDARQMADKAVEFQKDPGPLKGFLLALFTQSKKPSHPPFSASRPYMALGKLAVSQHDDEEAKARFQKAIELAPDSSRPHIALGQLFAAEKQMELAIEQYRQAIHNQPKRSRPHLQLAKFFKKQNRIDDAIPEYQAVEQLKSKHPHVHTVLGKLYQTKGNFDQAGVEYSTASALRPSKVRPATLLARLYGKQGRTGDAVHEAQRATMLDPNSWRPHIVLGQLLAKQNQPGNAQAELEAARELGPTKGKPTVALAKFLHDQKRIDDAQEVLSQDPQPNTRARLLLGETQQELGDKDAAAKSFQAAADAAPKKARPHVEMARLFIGESQRDKATAEFATAMQLEPSNGRVYLAVGRAQIPTKDWNAAHQYLDQALKLSANRSGPHVALGHVLLQEKKYAEATLRAQDGARLAPTKARPHTLLGKISRSQQNYDEAIAQYEQAARLDPGRAGPYIGKAAVLAKQQHYQEAAAQAEQALGHDPSKSRAYTMLGKLAGKDKKWEDALKRYEDALAAPPPGPSRRVNSRADQAKARPYFLTSVADDQLFRVDAAMEAARKGLAVKQSSARGHNQLGKLYVEKKDFGAADEEYATAERLEPTKTRSTLLRGLMKAQTGDVATAEATYQKALGVKDTARAHALLGKLYTSGKRLDEAMSQYGRVVALAPAKAVGYLLTGHLQGSQQDWKSALASFQAAIRNAPPNARAHIAAAGAESRLNDQAKALDEYQQAVQLAPTKGRPYLGKAAVLLKQQRYPEAAGQAQQALSQDPTKSRAYTMLGKLAGKDGHWDDALKRYQQAMHPPAPTTPSHRQHIRAQQAKARPYFLTASADDKLFRSAEAFAAVRQGLGIKDAARGHVVLGRLAAEGKDVGGAQAEFATAQRLQPTKTRALLLSGLLRQQAGQSDAAQAIYQQAIGVKDTGRAHALLGKLYAAGKQTDAAMAQYGQVISMQPTKAGGYLLVGHLRGAQGDWSGALRSFQDAIAKAAPKARAHVAAASAQSHLNNPTSSLDEYQQAIQLAPTKGRPYIGKSAVLVKQQRYAEAAGQAQQAISQDPSKSRAYTLLGKLAGKDTKWDNALAYYQKAIAPPPPTVRTHSLNPRPPRAAARPFFLTSVAQAKLARPDQAMSAAQQGLGVKDAARGHVLIGHLRAGEKDVLGADAEYARAQQLQPTKVRATMLRGLLKAQGSQPDAAEAFYQQAIAVKAKARGYTLIGQLRAKQSKWQDALGWFQKAQDAAATKARPRVAVGVARAHLNDQAGAIAAYQQAIQVNATKARPYLTWSHILKKNKQFDDALAKTQKALELKPTRAGPHNAMGHLYLHQKQYEPAIAQYAIGIGIRSDKARPQFALGRIYLRQKRFDDARTKFDLASKMQFDKGRFHVLLGKWHWEKGLITNAEIEFNAAIARIPTKARPHLMAGKAATTRRKYDLAGQEIGKAIQLAPTKARAHNLQGILYTEQQLADYARKEYQAAAGLRTDKARALILLGRLEDSLRTPPQHDAEFKAIAAYQQAAARKPTKAAGFAAMGRIYQRLDKLDEAYAALTKAIQLKPDGAGAHYRLALVNEGYQHWSDAINEWETYLALKPRGQISQQARAQLATLLGLHYTPRDSHEQERIAALQAKLRGQRDATRQAQRDGKGKP